MSNKQFRFGSALDANVLDDSQYNQLDLSRGFQSGTIIESIKVNSILKDHDIVANLVKDYYFGSNWPGFSDSYSSWLSKFSDAANNKVISILQDKKLTFGAGTTSSPEGVYFKNNKLALDKDIYRPNIDEDPYNLGNALDKTKYRLKALKSYKIGNIIRYNLIVEAINKNSSGPSFTFEPTSALARDIDSLFIRCNIIKRTKTISYAKASGREKPYYVIIKSETPEQKAYIQTARGSITGNNSSYNTSSLTATCEVTDSYFFSPSESGLHKDESSLTATDTDICYDLELEFIKNS